MVDVPRWRPKLGDAGSIIAITSAFALLCGIAHEYGFFSQVDSKLLGLMSIEDILANTLRSLPSALVPWAIGFSTRLMTLDIAPPRALQAYLIRGDVTGKAVALDFLLVVLTVVFMPNWPTVLMLNAVFVYLTLLNFLGARGQLAHKGVAEVAAAFLLGAVMFLSGASEGYYLRSTPDYVLVTNSLAETPVVLLRSTHNFLLVRLPGGEIDAVPVSTVTSLKQISTNPAKVSLIETLWTDFASSMLNFWRRVSGASS